MNLYYSCMKKKRYRSIAYAGKVAADIKKSRQVELRIYACRYCAGFHLTSRA